jgi:CheY-like chemotaxis protein
MTNKNKPIVILVADDDSDDRLMIREAFSDQPLATDLRFVVDGQDLMDYLQQQGEYKSIDQCPRPGIILLDLNMPKKDGREALKEIKENPTLKGIPIVVFTTSKAEEDIYRTYNLGVNSFISKPVTFEALVKIAKELGHYWFEIVELPTK